MQVYLSLIFFQVRSEVNLEIKVTGHRSELSKYECNKRVVDCLINLNSSISVQRGIQKVCNLNI